MNDILNSLEKALVDLFKPAPALPKSVKDVLVKIAPWAALVFGTLGIPAILAAFGIGAIAVPWMVIAGSGLQYWMSWALGSVAVVINLMAFKPLQGMKMRGWRLLFYGSLLGAVSNLIGFYWSGLIGTLIGWYVLFQVRGEYK